MFLAMYVVGANILVPRLINFSFFGLSFVVVTGAMVWPYTAQLSDMINEIYGRRSAYFSAAMAYLANLMFVGFVLMSFQLVPIWDPSQEGFYTSFFGVAGRIVLSSICSYTVANVVDINIFSRIKTWASKREKTAGNLLLYSGLRSALSDGTNMIIDTLIFYPLAFYGTIPNDVLVSLIFSSMAVKLILSQIDVPFYLLFRFLTRDVERAF
jgi:uncharacterized integral membrane protein (TIGR00697 family)